MFSARALVALTAFVLAFAAGAGVSAQQIACGPKPIPDPGCLVVRCQDGVWLQSCAPRLDGEGCGPPPIPDVGCQLGPCVDGTWQQECIYGKELLCPPKPEPPVGCKVRACIDGVWQLDCI